MHSGVTLAPLIGQLAALEILDGARVSSLEPYRPVAVYSLIRNRQHSRIRGHAILRDVHLQFAGSRARRHLEIDLIEADEAGRESGEDDGGSLRAHGDGGLHGDCASAAARPACAAAGSDAGIGGAHPDQIHDQILAGLGGTGAGDQREVGGVLRDDVRAVLDAGRRGTIIGGQYAGRGRNDIERQRQRECVVDAENDGDLLGGR